MPLAYARIADAVAHRDAIDALTKAAWDANHTESVQAAIAALRQTEQALSRPAPDFRFDRSRHGAEARVRQVMDGLRGGAAMGLCE